MNIAIIGRGAIAQYVMRALEHRGHRVSAVLLAPGRTTAAHEIDNVADLPVATDLVIDCAGHAGLAMHGPAVLAGGRDVITLSIGALADQALAQSLETAAKTGQARLHLASGAIGALDCLAAARVGALASVTYTGRKPPAGWMGSPAEGKLDLGALTKPCKHFSGSARQAALDYPKNANVAAAVALAGLGFDDTRVELIADPGVDQNIHEVHATGDFGEFRFQISGNALPDNPRSSALAAMSVLSKLDQLTKAVTL